MRLHLRAAHLIIGVAHADAASPDKVAHVPPHRADAQYAIFQRHLRRIGLQLRDARVDASDIAFGTFQHARRQVGKFGVDVAAIVEQARRLVRRDEGFAKSFGHAPHVAAMVDIDLEQPITRDQIALAEIRIMQRIGAHMGHTQFVFDNVDWRTRSGQSHAGRPALYQRLRQRGHSRHGESGCGGQQKCTTLKQYSLPFLIRIKFRVRSP